jgi:hypothetical protein
VELTGWTGFSGWSSKARSASCRSVRKADIIDEMTRFSGLTLLVVSLSLLSTSCGYQAGLPTDARIVETFSDASGTANVFIHLPEEKFNKDAIESIVAFYRPQCSPSKLNVIIYSDPDLLAKRIAYERAPDIRDFTNDEKGRAAAKKLVQQTHWPEGTMVAEYDRFFPREYYEYRFSKDAVKPAVIQFDPKNDPYHCELEGNRKVE